MTLQALVNIDVAGRDGASAIYLLKKAERSAAAASIAQRRDYSRHWTPS